MIPDELFMRRAFELAQLGTGYVSPNPRVGCVIVRNEKIIGEGWHRKFGESHAEVNAIASVEEKELLAGSVVYVNLEPCSHHGKTPPCADLLVRHRVKKVFISNQDTHPLVGGQGIKKLRDAGIEVTMGILEKEGRELNKRFFMFVEHHRPYIILKWAETADGFVAHSNYESKWISNEYSRQLVHRWRSEEDAVLVGARTAAQDNPMLNVRDWSGRDPVRIVIDRALSLPENLRVWQGPQKTLCYNVIRSEERDHSFFIRLDEADFISQLLGDLHQRGIQSVMVEGGARTLDLFISSGKWDEARIFTSPGSFGSGILAPHLNGSQTDVEVEHVFSDELKIVSHGKNKS